MSEQRRLRVVLRLDFKVGDEGRLEIEDAGVIGRVEDPWPQDQPEFGVAIKQARIKANLSQAKLAVKARLSEMTLRNVENGKAVSDPTREAIVSILKSMGQNPIGTLQAREQSREALQQAIDLLDSQVGERLRRKK